MMFRMQMNGYFCEEADDVNVITGLYDNDVQFTVEA